MRNLESEAELVQHSGKVVIKYWATWCGPCKKMDPVLAKLVAEFPEIEFLGVDVDQTPDLAKKYQVKAMPTLLFLQDGIEVNRVVGVSLIEPLRTLLGAWSIK